MPLNALDNGWDTGFTSNIEFYHELDTSLLSNGLNIFFTSDKDNGLNTGFKYYDSAADTLSNGLDNGMDTGSISDTLFISDNDLCSIYYTFLN